MSIKLCLDVGNKEYNILRYCGANVMSAFDIDNNNRAIFVWPCKMVSVSVSYLFHQPMDEWVKTWPLRFPAKENPNVKRHCSIGQSRRSMTSKRSIGWFLESSGAWSFFTRAFAQPTKSRVRLYLFDKPIKSLYFRSFVVPVLLARFHFEVIRKSL